MQVVTHDAFLCRDLSTGDRPACGRCCCALGARFCGVEANASRLSSSSEKEELLEISFCGENERFALCLRWCMSSSVEGTRTTVFAPAPVSPRVFQKALEEQHYCCCYTSSRIMHTCSSKLLFLLLFSKFVPLYYGSVVVHWPSCEHE